MPSCLPPTQHVGSFDDFWNLELLCVRSSASRYCCFAPPNKWIQIPCCYDDQVNRSPKFNRGLAERRRTDNYFNKIFLMLAIAEHEQFQWILSVSQRKKQVFFLFKNKCTSFCRSRVLPDMSSDCFQWFYIFGLKPQTLVTFWVKLDRFVEIRIFSRLTMMCFYHLVLWCHCWEVDQWQISATAECCCHWLRMASLQLKPLRDFGCPRLGFITPHEEPLGTWSTPKQHQFDYQSPTWQRAGDQVCNKMFSSI